MGWRVNGGVVSWRSTLAAGVGLGLALSVGRPGLAQESGCAPVAVGEGTGIYFLVLSQLCGRSLADGYTVIADLARDDQDQELLVLVDAASDQQTRLVAQVLANEVKIGGVDGSTWHVSVGGDAPEAPAPPAPDDGGSSGWALTTL